MGIINGDLSDYPAQGDFSTWQDLLDQGRGIGAQFISQPFDVFRVGATSNGDYTQSGNKIYSNFPCVRKKPEKMLLETGKGLTYFYDLMADMALLQVGDCFILNDPVYGAGSTSVAFSTNQYVGFVLATHPVLQRNVGARVDRNVRIYRQQILGDPTTGYLNQTFDGAKPLVCTAGVWDFGAPGDTPSKIPSGFMQERKVRPPSIPGLEDQTPGTMWSIWVPPLKGIYLKEADWLVTDDNARYRIINPYEQDAGATGSQLLCHREVSQTP